MAQHEREMLADQLEHSVALFSASDRREIRRLIRSALELEAATASADDPAAREPTRQELPIRTEVDVNVARAEARRFALAAGLRGASPVKVASAVSELARNVVLYAGAGVIVLERVRTGTASTLRVTCRDDGPGIDPGKLELIMSGRYVSKSGLGKGISAVRRLGDRFEISSKLGVGTTIVVEFRTG